MTAAQDVLRELEALGSEQTRKTYRRHRVTEPMFGVKFGDLDKLRKRLGRDQALARALWQSKNHDARVLAAMIADPAAFDLESLGRWQAEATCNMQSDALIAHVGARLPAAAAAAAAWIDATGESQRRAGWVLVAHLTQESPDLEDSFFSDLLPRIEREIHGAPNRTREAMNRALIAIGARSDALARRATAAARKIGPVEVDHGDTDCKTPDAVSYIAKAREHRAKQEAKGGGKAAAKKTAAKATPAKSAVAKKATAKKATAEKATAKRAASKARSARATG
ncbi:DNA alkylation repair enzyme [Nannocystis exedens]|uniref:DNA alkylation repair enzyme n=1 Tax=Nannocystis exedens TaxID=54 RepID=A0A1I1YAN0_9BACT|nr:DNA alkylation repair protein [Nannocystis exedens]PCC71932.1 DNA alkylation repair protein [Nannocystis exedens]SFE16657.1 DNA alkylation repair enzyme [Nannocystis exedens]